MSKSKQSPLREQAYSLYDQFWAALALGRQGYHDEAYQVLAMIGHEAQRTMGFESTEAQLWCEGKKNKFRPR